MNSSAILRFSDAEASTIPAHDKILGEKGVTWWGWWKKQTEHFKGELLRDLQFESRRRAVEIGLVKRKGEEELYVASCIDVSFDSDGSPTGSPEPELTPEYYRATSFPAWFKFNRIREVGKSAFERQFGFVPSQNPTLYEVFRDADGKFRIIPGPSWSMEIVKAPGDAILHLSDLHFGADHGFPLSPSTPGTSIDGRRLVDIISSRVVQDLRARLGAVVVSGDLITCGAADAYPHAKEFLEHLLGVFDLSPQHCVIVPGNHDLWTLGVDHPSHDYGHEQPYQIFAEAFFSTKLQDLERVRRYRTPGGYELIFVELNSARLRSDSLREYGYVARHRYSELLQFVDKVLDQDTGTPVARLKFAVLHHHLIPVGPVTVPGDKKPVSLCLDAGELISEFQAHRVRFVLHGHEHAPFLGEVARFAGPLPSDKVWDYPKDQVFVLGCGSSGAKSSRLPPELGRNTFGIYQPKDGALQVKFEQYSHTLPCTSLWQTSLPIG